MLELDDRIISNAHPYDCFSNTEEVSQYSKGWFSNVLEDFTNLGNTTFDTLTGVKNSKSAYPFQTEKAFYKFFLPECMAIVYKKFRVYDSVSEMPFQVGDILFIRDKETQDIEKCMCTGVSCVNNSVGLGTTTYSAQELLDDYEWRFTETGDWKPFGVEE